jgi:hypothetical protein
LVPVEFESIELKHLLLKPVGSPPVLLGAVVPPVVLVGQENLAVGPPTAVADYSQFVVAAADLQLAND